MQFGVGVEYAFHSLFFLAGLPKGRTVGIKDIARLNGLAEPYLSKIFSRLRRGGIVRSVPGAKGGYELARPPESISFWDVVEAVEGSSYAFKCAEIRRSGALVADPREYDGSGPCLIRAVMEEGEEQMRQHLRGKSLAWLYATASKGFNKTKKKALASWLDEAGS
jgi:Rrf2 family protein